MASGHVLDMQPGLIRVRAEGQLFVLGGVLAHQDLNAVRGQIAVGPGFGKIALLLAAGGALDVTGADQVLTDVLQVALGRAFVHVQKRALEIGELLQCFFLLLGRGLAGIARLLVLFEEALGVLDRGELLVQGNADTAAVFVIEVGQRDFPHAFLDLPEIGVDDVAHDPVFFHARGTGEFFFLKGKLAFAALNLGFQDAHHGCALLLQSVLEVTVSEKAFHGLGQGAAFPLLGRLLGEIGEGEEILTRAVLQHQAARAFQLRQTVGQVRGAHTGVVHVLRAAHEAVHHASGELPRADGAEAHDLPAQQFIQSKTGILQHGSFQAPGKHFAGNHLFLGRRRGIGEAWYDLTHTVHVGTDMARGFQNPVVLIGKDEIGVPAHHFQNQAPADMVAHFIDGVQVHMDHAVAV